MITRRNFIRNLALAGIGLPMVTGLFPNPPTDSSFSCHWKDLKVEGLHFAGIADAPIQEGEKVKDLKEYPFCNVPTFISREKQPNGSTICSRGEIFVVIDGRYCRVTGLEEIAREDSLCHRKKEKNGTTKLLEKQLS